MKNEKKPAYVTDLETNFGEPSQEGFGSAVFFKTLKTGDMLEDEALAQYEYFVGDKWQEWGAETWLGPWKEAYCRPKAAEHDVLAELTAIEDFQTKMSVDLLLNGVENPEEAQAALAAAYDDSQVSAFCVYNTGDGEAMSGLLLAGRREDGETTFLVLLMD